MLSGRGVIPARQHGFVLAECFTKHGLQYRRYPPDTGDGYRTNRYGNSRQGFYPGTRQRMAMTITKQKRYGCWLGKMKCRLMTELVGKRKFRGLMGQLASGVNRRDGTAYGRPQNE